MRARLAGVVGEDRRTIPDVEAGGGDAQPEETRQLEAVSAVVTQSVFAVDPGPIESGYCWYDGRVLSAGIVENALLYGWIRTNMFGTKTAYVFEKIRSYGRPVGASVFETCFWTGRMYEAAATITSMGAPVQRIEFGDVKKHLCPGAKGKDADFRKALCVRVAGSEREAKGTKASPGPLYGISGHMWSALALAVTWWDRSRCVRALAEQQRQMHKDVGLF